MAKQLIRFNYFEPFLVGEEETVLWDMKPFLEFLLNNRNGIHGAVVLGDEVSDVEWNAMGYDNSNDLYYLQLSKLRSKNIPSKKRINEDKVAIDLAEDEFLGEFNLIIFDPIHNVFMLQSNFYGLNINQVQIALGGLRQRFKDYIGEPEGESPYGIYLKPIMDTQAIGRAIRSEIYRKVTIKGGNYNAIENVEINNSVLNSTVNMLNEVHGVNFELTLSMSSAPRDESLDQEEVREIIDNVLRLKEQDVDVSMNVTSKEDEEHAVEIINLMSPRLTTSIKLDVINRATIGHEYIYIGFLEQNYINEEKHIRNIIGRTIVR